MVAAGIAFAVLAPRLVPGGAAAPQAKLLIALVYILVVLLGAAWLWRRSDEVERERARNTLAAMGLSGFVLTIVVMLAAPVFHLRNPAMTVWTIGLIVGAAVHIAQRLRN
jgi:cytochrome bd-type quinol oxidase subunit 2